jgi:hypothetical protein
VLDSESVTTVVPPKQPPALPLALASLGFMSLAIVGVWSVDTLGGDPDLFYLVPGLIAVGAAVARLTQRWWPFLLSTAITVVILVLPLFSWWWNPAAPID